MTRTGKRRKSKKKNSRLLLFGVFTAVAVVTIVLLEYIDFKRGEKSFIFSKIIPLGEKEDRIDRFNTQLIRLLTKNKIPYDYFPDRENKYHFKLEIDLSGFDGLIGKIKAITARFDGVLELTEIQGLSDKSILLYKARFGREVSHLLLITKRKPAAKVSGKKRARQEETPGKRPEKKAVPPPRSSRSPEPPRIAFIIDDMGAYETGALELKRLNIPITASVLPDSRRAREVVHWLGEYRLKAMIHLPMQPTNSNGRKYDPAKVVTLRSSDEQIRALIRRAKKVIPIAEGLNNHEGSLVTADRRMMKRVMEIIKEEKLFFVDSRTIGRTAAYDVARELGVKAARKDVFLDHIATYSHSMAQVRKLVEIALRNGRAIAIGHPFETTLRAIADSKRYIKAKGVKIVYVKELLE